MSNRLLTVLRQSGTRVFLKGVLAIAVLAVVGYLANSINFEETFSSLPFSASVDAKWYQGPVGFILLGALLISISCPRQVVSFFAAYFFGLSTGFIVAWIGTIAACLLTYGIARLFSGYFQDFVKGKLDIALQFWKDNTFLATVIWRFLPAGSNFLTNLAAGAFSIPASRFVAGSAVGYVPQTLIFAIVGSGARVESEVQILVSAGLFAISALLGLLLFARYRKKIKSGS
ncbi:MAG: TVP38/TMEM64 family protein [Rhizobiaceae bacterium]